MLNDSEDMNMVYMLQVVGSGDIFEVETGRNSLGIKGKALADKERIL